MKRKICKYLFKILTNEADLLLYLLKFTIVKI